LETFNLVLGILGGGSAALTALFAYFGNLRLEKFKSDLAETNAKLKASLDSSVHVSKAQFDKEFSIYQQVWISLVALRARTLSLRPVMDFYDPNETEDERGARRLKAFGESFYAFRDIMEQNKPFYSIGVYQSLVEIFDLCHKESIEYQHKEPGWSSEYWESSRENNKKIVEIIDKCCELIRQRISSFSVVGENG
jgi:hypothetical protein